MKDLSSSVGKNGKIRQGDVYRRTTIPYDHRGHRIIVGLHPGNVISFREEKCRKRFTAPIRQLMQTVIQWAVIKRLEEKKLARGGKRLARRGRVRA